MPPTKAGPIQDTASKVAFSSDSKPKAFIELRPPRKVIKDHGVEADSKGFFLPTGFNAVVKVSVESVTFRKGIVRQVRANAELAEGEITLSQLAAQFPGGSDIAIFGFITTEKKNPRFEGEVEASANDLRRVMKWLDFPVPDVSAERLRKLTITSRIAATQKQIICDFAVDDDCATTAMH